VNMYGITETTVHVTYRALTADDVRRAPGSVIGGPIPDLQLYVLDAHLEPVPIGVAGEIFVGGAGVARGYLNRSELTAARFVADRFSAGDNRSDARLYRSGDRARFLANGDLEYLGRGDQQVKISGFRIELGEIEAALNLHPRVRESVVEARPGRDGVPELVAWVATREKAPLTTSDLATFVGQKLPAYMVPSAFVLLDALPLNANGKLDRAALPAPAAQAAPGDGAGLQPPRTPLEEVLAGIWEEALGRDRVGVTDNYFDLGGDSIRSIQLVARARAHGVRFTVPQLFAHPTVRQLAAALADGDDDGAATPPPLAPFALLSDGDRALVPPDLEDVYPLTELQAGMVFHSRYSDDAATYHDVSSFALAGRLDDALLARALATLVAEHPILRTSFDFTRYSEPMQRVHADAQLPLERANLSALPAAEQEAAVAAWIDREKRRPFDWQAPPLLRLALYQRGPEQFQLGVSFHHAILDGWSVALMLSSLFHGYTTLLAGRARMPPAPSQLQFRDYVALERTARDNQPTRDFWTQALHGADSARLPAADPATAVDGATVRAVPLAPETYAGLKRLARAAAVPLKSVLLAAHLRVVALVSGQRDVVTGLVTNGRPEVGDGERILGLFLNTVPLRFDVAPGSWTDLTRDVFAAERALLPHRRYPMAALQRQRGGGPLFTTAFNFTHFHVYDGLRDIPGLRVLDGHFFGQTDIPLTANFGLDAAGSRLQLELGFDTGGLSPAQMDRLVDYYARTLAAMAADATARHDRAALLSPAEHHQLVHAWNATDGAAATALLPELLAAQARRTPDAIAIDDDGARTLTFGEVDAHAERLARRLRGRGIGADTIVGIVAERAPDTLIAMLAVWKSGGAYLPLDPSLPSERLAFMCADAHVALLLAPPDALPALDLPRLTIDCQGDGDGDGSSDGDDLPPAPIAPEQLAYVIYTSGSTGKPKGVAVPHRALANHAVAVARAYALGPADRVLQFAALGFDVAAEELFPTWLSGARVVLGPRALPSPAALEALVARAGLTVVNLPAGFWHEWVDDRERRGHDPLAASLRLVVVGSDRVRADRAATWRRRGGPRLVNGYGPTEATITATLHDVDDAAAHEELVPIGRPIASTRAYVLDAALAPVPLGAAGELYLGGAGVARGYLGRPALTAERFVPDPFGGEAGARLYRTGDRARFRDDGALVFLGRNDEQVKLRGLRVELGEIEAALRALPDVADAAVALYDVAGTPALVGYVVARVVVDDERLRAALGQRLPAHMIPAALVTLPSLPLLPSGKLDRRALPVPASLAGDARAAYVAPANDLETLLAAIWAEILALPEVGAHDHFFQLGGHSLLVIQVA
ncbi:MAG TPA: amino acid adenylation domain-containing protein, partial [Polyangia bacterium]|nr:amino acid adenylation domain-containing protein [Polyangia bacterium]